MTGAPLPAGPFTELSARRLGPVRRFFVRRPVAMDVVVMLWFAAPTALVATSGDTGAIASHLGEVLARQVFLATLALTTVGTVVLYWRRRRPVLVAALLTVLGVVSLAFAGSTGGFELGVAFALYAVAASQRAAVTWTTAAGASAALLAAAGLLELPARVGAVTTIGIGDPGSVDLEVLIEASRQEIWLFNAGAVLFFALLAIAIGTSVRNRRLHVADLIDRANALARDRDQQTRLARAAERARIAREMHDVVAHSVSVMIALGDGAAAALDRSPDRTRAALEELSETGRSALADMRRVLGVLHGTEESEGEDPGEAEAPFDPQPTSHDLVTLVERFRTAGLPVRSTGVGVDVLPADTSLQLAAYRIVQEALTNALRYARGTAGVELALRRATGGIEIVVLDHGPAVPVEGSQGAARGLIGMRERAAVYGGTVDAGPYGNGWRVRALLPWHEGTR